MKWSREDYTGSAVETAKHLIGAVLVHETKEGITAGRITECEAYGGFYRGKPDDGAHSYKGLTPRTQAIFWRRRAYLCIYDLWDVLVHERGLRP